MNYTMMTKKISIPDPRVFKATKKDRLFSEAVL